MGFGERAARVAAFIKKTCGIEPLVEVGEKGEFSVWVNGRRVAKRGRFGIPGDRRIRWAVKWALLRKH